MGDSAFNGLGALPNSSREAISRAGQGLIAETMPRLACSASSGLAMTSGLVYYMNVPLVAGDKISSISFGCGVAGSALTLCKLGLYKKDGTLLASTADQSAAWVSTGFKTAALLVPYVVPTSDIYYVGALAVGTGPQPMRGLNAAANSFVFNGLGSGFPAAATQTGQSDLPSPGVIAVGTTTVIFWYGLS